MEVKGGFSNWSIGYEKGEADYIVVKANHYPNEVEIRLFDVLPQDIEDLAKMFMSLHLENKLNEKSKKEHNVPQPTPMPSHGTPRTP
jgi:hypothetical protein